MLKRSNVVHNIKADMNHNPEVLLFLKCQVSHKADGLIFCYLCWHRQYTIALFMVYLGIFFKMHYNHP